jgi:dihydroorotase
MMNRRQFVSAAAAGAALFARVPNVLAATYDLIIRGGLVIDPSIGLDAIRDVAITGGRRPTSWATPRRRSMRAAGSSRRD